MYNLNDFCNIIARLRREKGWTQADLAEKIGISPQSISKWECGIGFPDVTLFPLIAETFSVPIGILFGEQLNQKEGTVMEDNQNKTEFTESFEVCNTISVRCGNVCRIEVISGASSDHTLREGLCAEGKGHVRAVGDPVFLRYLTVEQVSGQREPDGLLINIKNPTGSAVCWNPYDRQGFTGENYVQIFTGGSKNDVNVNIYNYLNLHLTSGTNPQGNFEAVSQPMA